MAGQFVTGNKAYRPRAELLVDAIRPKPHDDKVDIVADALKREFGAGLNAGWRGAIDASSISATLTSAAARLIGLATRDGRPELIDRCAEGLIRAIDGLEEFAVLAGSDTGAEPIQAVLRELVGYMRERDYEGASAALMRRIAVDKKKPDSGAYDTAPWGVWLKTESWELVDGEPWTGTRAEAEERARNVKAWPGPLVISVESRPYSLNGPADEFMRCDQCGLSVAKREGGGIATHRCPHGVECILEPGDPRIGRGGWGCGVCRAAAAAGEFDEQS